MHTQRKIWIVLAGALAGMLAIACTCSALTPTPPAPTIPANPLPALEGYWYDSDTDDVHTIAWQGGRYVVAAVDNPDYGSYEVTSQSWDGSTLTWTYLVSHSGVSVTFTTLSVSGDSLFTNWLNSEGDSGTWTLERVASAHPPLPSDGGSEDTGGYTSLPIYEDFSDTGTGWEAADYDDGSVGYGSGYYFVRATGETVNMYGMANQYLRDMVIDVDAAQVEGPGNNKTGYGIICRLQGGDQLDAGYYFRVSGDGMFSAAFGRPSEFESLTGSELWQGTAAVVQGNAANHLKVTCDGDHLVFEVNGIVLFDGYDSTYPDGDIALLGVTYESGSPAEFHFTNLSVTAP